jgi:hypothetical protein
MEMLIKLINKEMKKLLFVLAVALSACKFTTSTEPVTKDSTSIDTTAVGIDSVLIDSTKIIDTIKK